MGAREAVRLSFEKNVDVVSADAFLGGGEDGDLGGLVRERERETVLSGEHDRDRDELKRELLVDDLRLLPLGGGEYLLLSRSGDGEYLLSSGDLESNLPPLRRYHISSPLPRLPPSKSVEYDLVTPPHVPFIALNPLPVDLLVNLPLSLPLNFPTLLFSFFSPHAFLGFALTFTFSLAFVPRKVRDVTSWTRLGC
ncbi:hypothetical protein PQX77_018875 [Marasmius sp. AFHP31]|nr:hypothetical protein PQX77_018875 [Marasmius sp. AFHP31]